MLKIYIYIGINAHVIDTGQTTTTRDDRATQLLICATVSFAIISEHAKDWDTKQIIQKPYNKSDRCLAILYNRRQFASQKSNQ